MGKNHTSGISSITAAKSIAAEKSQNFVDFTGMQKSTHKKMYYAHYPKHETDYILEVWQKDCHLKETDISVTIFKILHCLYSTLLQVSPFAASHISASFFSP